MALTEAQRAWYIDQLGTLDKAKAIVYIDKRNDYLNYSNLLRTDETTTRNTDPEEFVHAVGICLLCSNQYKYNVGKLYHEQHFAHGSRGSKSDEVDLIIYDEDDLPFALWEFKAHDIYDKEEERAIELQLFGTAPLTQSY